MSTLEFFGAAEGLMRVCSEGSRGKVEEQKGKEGRGEEIKASGEKERK